MAKKTPEELMAMKLAKEELEIDPWEGLTDQQTHIQALRFRGVTQVAIGKILGVSQPHINQQLKKIKEIHAKKGAQIDQDVFIGMSVSKFDLLEQKAWEIYHKENTKDKVNTAVQMQALQTIASLQEKKAKLLLDLGLLKRAAQQHEHTIKPGGPTFVDDWEASRREQLAQNIIISQMKALPEPEAPYDDAEIIDTEGEEEQ
jgi:predicted transcriptional regulator